MKNYQEKKYKNKNNNKLLYINNVVKNVMTSPPNSHYNLFYN